MKILPRYYWDTNMFVLVLDEQRQHGPEVLAAAEYWLEEMMHGRAVILTSAAMVAEILPDKHNREKWDLFQSWLRCKNLVVQPIDSRVARRSALLRQQCRASMSSIDKGRFFYDVSHVATALIYDDDIHEIHALDGDFKRILQYANAAREVTVPKLPTPPPSKPTERELLEQQGQQNLFEGKDEA